MFNFGENWKIMEFVYRRSDTIYMRKMKFSSLDKMINFNLFNEFKLYTKNVICVSH